MVSCKPKTPAAAAPFTFNKPGGAPISPTAPAAMTLFNPLSSPSFIANPTVTLSGLVVGEMVKIYRNSTCSTLIGTTTATATSMNVTLSSLPVGTHEFFTKTTNTFTTSACSASMLSYQYLGVAPQNATSITLMAPGTNPSADSTPTLILAGVKSGETSRIFIDPACSTVYGSGVASGTTVTITSLAVAIGTHNFYVNSSNAAGTNVCSGALYTYQYTGVLPTSATNLILTNPETSPNYDSTPTVTLSGVANGDTVELFSDAGCTTQVGSAVADYTSNAVITTSALAVGAYNFYSYSTNVIGSSACSSMLGSYTYSGPPPTVAVSWIANRETAVNSLGGGYRVYYSRTNNFDITTASFVNVPFVSGTAPTTVNFNTLMAGITYFKVQAYSALNAPNLTTGSQSAASTQFSVNIP